jgi:hypothetical protein
LALGGAIAACGQSRAPEPMATRASALVSGVPSPSPDDDAVMLLRQVASQGETICTATLVAPNLIVTVRHCVAYLIDGSYKCTLRGELVEGPDGAGNLGADVLPSAVEVHTGTTASVAAAALGKQIFSTLSLTACIDDLAFVVLDRNLPGPIAPIRLGRETRVGESVTLIGYGGNSVDVFDWHSSQRMRLADQTIAAVGPDSAEGTVPLVVPRTFELHGPSACSGDSGGPALSQATGAVVGVYSNRLPSNCLDPSAVNTYTNLTSFAPLAQRAFAAAGASPMLEAPGAAMGQACKTTEECERGVCATADDGASRCTVVCGIDAPCPSGYSCRTGADASSKFCTPSSAVGCTCGGAPCACDAGSPQSIIVESTGCAVARCAPRGNQGQVIPCGLLLGALGPIGRRMRRRRRRRSRCPTRIGTASW